MGQEIFSVVRGGAGMGQEKSMRGGGEDPILWPHPVPLPSLITHGYRDQEIYFLCEKLFRLYAIGFYKQVFFDLHC